MQAGLQSENATRTPQRVGHVPLRADVWAHPRLIFVTYSCQAKPRLVNSAVWLEIGLEMKLTRT